MIVAGIDPSLTNTGIAILSDGQPLSLRSVGHGTPNGKTYGHRSDRIVSLCRAVVDAVVLAEDAKPALAVMEGPAYGANLPSAHDRAGLFWGLYSTLRARKIPIAVIPPATRAKWATGKGNADKTTVLATVRSWWPTTHIANHDQADALVLATIGAFHHNDPMPFPIKERHTANLAAVQWPAELEAR
ncbi:crossover junction endodeoxyribonuclease RuvC [Mycobacterium intracellulare]|uniref:crossover junction endodeoxyribonuclease RuvC n=1 Tax=Mycobacterium intracellulare TaxID=1767 RepID=UPI001929542F|nr:crossover junction endodeoxyribonuclease RuvC [Mycobacterium intracellulare]MCA2275483.1 crossover junction endodeoxyribonuclease RuvC [Mycobacterium intracellulare]MCA2324443.1 crossover junction endodeoxyribonuclease RuvC [Mycobacterium intracellulare]BCP29587.1 hypothetical protein MINTM026_05570 [Mycobacterium intracellulare]